MWRSQNRICPLCERSIDITEAVLDHDHSKTGRTAGMIRGVLCRWCNSNEGRVRNIAVRSKRNLHYREWLENVVTYQKHHEDNPSECIHPTHLKPKRRRNK